MYILLLNITSSEWISYIITFLSGGILTYIFEQISKRGKCYLKDTYINMKYEFTGPSTISAIGIDLKFINTSGNQHLVTDMIFTLFDGESSCYLGILNHNLPPDLIVKPNSIETLNLKGDMDVPFDYTIRNKHLQDSSAYIMLTYKINKALFTKYIYSNEFNIEYDNYQ